MNRFKRVGVYTIGLLWVSLGFFANVAPAATDCTNTITYSGPLYTATDDYVTSSTTVPCISLTGPGIDMNGHSITCNSNSGQCYRAISAVGNSANTNVIVKNAVIQGIWAVAIDASAAVTVPAITANKINTGSPGLYNTYSIWTTGGRYANNVTTYLQVSGNVITGGCGYGIWLDATNPGDVVEENYIDCASGAVGIGVNVNWTTYISNNFVRAPSFDIYGSGQNRVLGVYSNVLASARGGTNAPGYYEGRRLYVFGATTNTCDQDLIARDTTHLTCVQPNTPYTLP
jgi:hypothetical protein